ncbi:MAG TPA: glycosyltransferase family 9 protein [Candidatus Krumholzibacteria bacterium]|nr:glycosyltransferase family 9 protein [Candidatus Krumholzibacteria bacterium]
MTTTTLTHRRDRVVEMLTPLLGRMVGHEPFSLPADINDSSRVLVVDSGDLTELLFFAPVLNHLKRRYPGMRITVLVREGNGELIRTLEPISEMISYEPEHLSLFSSTFYALLRRIRGRGFNVVFLLGHEFSFARSLAALVSNARLRVAFSQRFTYPFVNCEIRANGDGQYEAPRALSFLSVLGQSPGDNVMAWRLPEADVRWATQMIHFRRSHGDGMLIAVDPGMGKGNHRLVDTAMAYVASEVARRNGGKLLLLSNNLDGKAMARFRSLLKGSLVDIEPKNIKEALALLSRADLVLAGNTDYFHFAVSMRRPTIGFFTRFDGPNWFPKSAQHVQIIQGVRGQKVSVDEVCSKIDTLLQLTTR